MVNKIPLIEPYCLSPNSFYSQAEGLTSDQAWSAAEPIRCVFNNRAFDFQGKIPGLVLSFFVYTTSQNFHHKIVCWWDDCIQVISQ